MKKIQDKILAEREAAALFPAVRSVLEAFDGKVLNCRLEKALCEKSGARIYMNKRYKWLEMYVYTERYTEPIYICQIELDKLTDGKRIPGALMIEAARNSREKLLKNAADLESSLDHVQEWKEQLAYLKNQMKAICGNIPYEIRDTFGLHD